MKPKFKLKFHDDFKKDYRKVIKRVADPKKLDRELKTVAHALLAEQEVPDKYVTNTIPRAGVGWYECFVYHDKKDVIIIQYKIKGYRIYLARIGTPSALTKKVIVHVESKY